jgi:hypothetical protein
MGHPRQITTVSTESGRVVFTCAPDERAYNAIGTVHGGLVCTLLDAVMGGAQVEKRRAFRRTIKWRTGYEGRISTLKRGYGRDRTRLDSLEGAKTWTGQGVFTHNLIKIAALIA